LSIRVGCKRDTGLRRKKMGDKGLEEAREEEGERERRRREGTWKKRENDQEEGQETSERTLRAT
jgi:hypothetical protein